MFSEITRLLQERGSLSVSELAMALQTDAGALTPMLEMLEHKGRVCKLDLPCGGGCSSCNCADAAKMTFYKLAA